MKHFGRGYNILGTSAVYAQSGLNFRRVKPILLVLLHKRISQH
jgi:hypothetical protein